MPTFDIQISEFGHAMDLIQATDLEALNRLRAQLSEDASPLAGITEAQLRLTTSNTAFVTARDPETRQLVGMATLLNTSTLLRNALDLHDFIVDQSCQGQKLGRRMMEAILGFAKQKRFDHIDLTCRPFRMHANNLYQKVGFELRDTNPYRLTLKPRA